MFDTAKEAAVAYDLAALKAGRPRSSFKFPGRVPKIYKPKKKKLTSRNTIGFRGVFKRGNRFMVQIQINGKKQYIGIFDTPEEAAIAYDLAAIKAERPTSDLNFPEMIHIKLEPGKKKRKLSRSHNKSGFNGVSKSRKKFTANIRIDGKINYLGTFTTASSAAVAYDNAVLKHGLPESKLNYPDGVPDEEQEDDEDGVWL